MKDIKDYLDSTYLALPQQSGFTEEQTSKRVDELVREAIEQKFFAVMLRPDYVKKAKNTILEHRSSVKVGTVIGFHEGTTSIEEKLAEAQKAIEDGVDELDFVINFEAYKNGNIELVKEEVKRCTQRALKNAKIAKWIIEIAALDNEQIADITKRIALWTEENFPESTDKVFIKSSTGFYKTQDGKPAGATVEGIQIMLENAGRLPVKAAGGVKSPEEAIRMIELGVQRIGTSSASSLAKGDIIKGPY
ncbi:deoxyribose-phosphate aldolase [Elizabethkingia argentiflava]|uniref:Deoxyribose-phosphate aldolase n=1 Tax=Elizabethkingia argenteiflava TaxID=2681556 RepID=A0A845PQP1_9FLAO|nr:deoxyribose-phosphate aldolase [Elizabethkingia argenteiflava]NAW50512.1 deoxyribose-phosphate aldolase [Elizabethkingia argenteiflava]